LARAEDLTKGWLLALLEERELREAPAILAADIVREGPRLCEAIVRALADDHDLRRLEPGGALERLASRAGEMAGTSQAEGSVRAVDALRAVIWSALREELVRPEADLVEALAERLSRVAELVRAAVLRRFGAAEGEGGEPPEVPRGLAEVVAIGEEAAPDWQGRPAAEPAPEPLAPGRHFSGPREPGLRPVAEGLAPMTADSLWRGALEDEVAKAQRSGSKLALLLAELSDSERVSVVEPLHVASETFGRFAQAVRSALRREDILACETESRAWIIARTTGRTGARSLGSRVAAAVQEAEPWRGASLTVGIGIAVLGEDAHDAVGLIEAADEWTFAAVSAGLATVESPEHAGGG
ncbi:MAG TPA: diguanylate cyclase, partial [Solirubrobacteraceae bacterium]|nr:diguanylate cyclase [Solirubrobacteraceae bacterium]